MSALKLTKDQRGRTARIISIGLFAVLVVGLFRLQVMRHDELLSQSRENRIRVQPVVPRRGNLYDRYGKVIADNRPSYAVSIIRSELVKDVTIPRLSELINMDSARVMKRLRNNREPVYLPAVIKRDVDFEKVAILEEQSEKYPGVTINMERVRRYTPGLASECFTGYVGEVSAERRALGQEKLRAGSFVGKQGVEREQDPKLRGTEGIRYLEISARGVVLGELEDPPADPGTAGADIVLTIDAELQRLAANSFDTFCCGAVVALDPRNGEVLAMVSEPSYDANIFSSAISSETWDTIVNNPNKPLLNRPVGARYPPGSPFKLVTAGALLEESIVDRHTMFSPCLGGWQFGRRWFGCWNLGGHGKLDVVESIAQSCDAYFYQAGLKLGINKLAEYARKCGFGVRTGIDLPHEISGLVPTTDTLDKFYGRRGWTEGIMLNLSIGQGELLATPLQMAQFFAGIANDGDVYRPHLVQSINFADGSVVTTEPKVSFKLPFSPRTLKVLQEGALRVVHSEHGTARKIATPEFRQAGKTGTAENPHGENHSWYVGYAPYENPEIVIAAIVENGGHGSEVAAPMVGKLLKAYLELQKQRAEGAVASRTE